MSRQTKIYQLWSSAPDIFSTITSSWYFTVIHEQYFSLQKRSTKEFDKQGRKYEILQ